MSVDRRQRLLDIVVVTADRIELTETVQDCRDPKDNKYLELAAAGHAAVIVSSDVRHLQVMHPLALAMDCDPLRPPITWR